MGRGRPASDGVEMQTLRRDSQQTGRWGSQLSTRARSDFQAEAARTETLGQAWAGPVRTRGAPRPVGERGGSGRGARPIP